MCIIGTYATHTYVYIICICIYMYIYMMYIYIYMCVYDIYIYILCMIYACIHATQNCAPWFTLIDHDSPSNTYVFFPGRIMLYPYCIYIYILISFFFMLGGNRPCSDVDLWVVVFGVVWGGVITFICTCTHRSCRATDIYRPSSVALAHIRHAALQMSSVAIARTHTRRASLQKSSAVPAHPHFMLCCRHLLLPLPAYVMLR